MEVPAAVLAVLEDVLDCGGDDGDAHAQSSRIPNSVFFAPCLPHGVHA